MKNSEKKCMVPKSPKPTRKKYDDALKAVKESVKLLPNNTFSGFIRNVLSDSGLPAMHDYPSYGQPCWQQAYGEMQAVQTLQQLTCIGLMHKIQAICLNIFMI